MGAGHPAAGRRDVRECRGLQGAGTEEDRRPRIHDPAEHGGSGKRPEGGLRRARVQAAEPGVLPALEEKATDYAEHTEYVESRGSAASVFRVLRPAREPCL